MKASVKIFLVTLALFALAVLLFHDRKSVSVARSENRLEIYYMYNENESQADWFNAACDEFKTAFADKYPGIEIDVLYAGREVLGKLRPRMIIGNPPDIVNQGGDQLEPLIRAGLLEPLDEVLSLPAYDQDMPWRDTFIDGVFDIYAYEGHDYFIPTSLFCSVFFYDKVMFERLHITPPVTWEEFLSVCQTLKENGIEPIAADGTEIGYNIAWYAYAISRTTTVEHVLATAWNEPGTSWDEPCYVEGAEMVRLLRDKGYIMKGYEGSKWPSAQMNWVQGKCGLLYTGTWIPKEMKNALPDAFKMGIFRAPILESHPDGDSYAQDIGAECFAIPKGARHREAAIDFLRFITSKKQADILADMDVPSAIKGCRMPEALIGLDTYLSPPYKLIEGMAGIGSDLSEWYRIVPRNYWSDLFLGHIGPEEMCKEVEQAHLRYYERMKAIGGEPR